MDHSLYIELEKSILLLIKKQKETEKQLVEKNLLIEKLEAQLQELKKVNEQIKNDNETLKISQALSGNQEHSRLMKLKINNLVKEIETCIQLIDHKSI